MTFKEVFEVEKNSFIQGDGNKYLLFDGLDNDKMAALYEEIAAIINDKIIVVKLLPSNQNWLVSDLLKEVTEEDQIMRRYYQLESLLKKINSLELTNVSKDAKTKIMSAYQVYKKDDYNLEEINQAITDLNQVLKD